MDHAGFRGRLWISLLAVLFLGLTSGVAATDSNISPESEDFGEIAVLVKHWAGDCAEKEKARNNRDARQCWWDAAKMLDQYTRGDHPLTAAVRRLRIDWLWRALQLTLEAPDPRLAGPIGCASIRLGNYENCLTATIAPETSPKLAHPQAGEVTAPKGTAVDKRKKGKSGVSKTKVTADPVRRKVKRKIAAPAAVHPTEVVLSINPMPQKKKNFGRPYGWKSHNAMDWHKPKHEL